VQPTFLGLLVVALGLAVLFRREEVVVKTALLLTLLGSGAVVNLPSLGGASILAAPAFTGFIALRNLMTKGGALRFLAAFRVGSPGFWLMLAIVYGAVAAFLIGPFFHGKIEVYPVSRPAPEGEPTFLIPFEPMSGNLTQTVYSIGQLVLYGSVTALIATRRSHRAVLDGLVLLGAAHVAISLIDLATYYTGTGVLLDWLRTATYTSWTDNEIAGFKRISGLFPETSMYSIYAMTILGMTLRLVLARYRTRITQPVFYMTLVLLILSTSSTAYAALTVASALFLLVALKDAWLLERFRTMRIILVCGLALFLGAATLILLAPGLGEQARVLIDETITNKMSSTSGAERANLNAGAFKTFLDTLMLGAGIGSVRTSSFVLTLLSNLGLFGTVCFCLFIASLFGRDTSVRNGDPETKVLANAARWGVISGLIAASASFHVFDLGPLFYTLAALSHPRLLVAVSRPPTHAARQLARRGSPPAGTFARGA